MNRKLGRYGTGYPDSLFDGYVGALSAGGLADARTSLSKMLVCDFLMGNTDRHEYNLGVVLDAETKQMLRVAPIFDNGRSFYCDVRRPEQVTGGLFDYESRPFEPNPTAQLPLASDLEWLDLGALEEFSQEVRQVLSSNAEQRPWFAEAAARQFEIRLDFLRTRMA